MKSASATAEIIPGPRKKARLADGLTGLHDSVICHIVSRLPMKYAVRTSILSKEWRYRWTASYNLDIDSILRIWTTRSSDINTMPSIVKVIDRLVVSLKHLKSFRIRSYRYYYDTDRCNRWASAALEHNLESFEIGDAVKHLVVPVHRLDNTSLRRFKMKCSVTCDCRLNVAAKNYARNLTSLYLKEVSITTGNPNINTLTFKFPVLETLELRDCKLAPDVKYMEIYAPSLTKYISRHDNDWRVHPYSIVMVAPKLSTLKHLGGIPEKLTLIGSPILYAYLGGGYSTEWDPDLCRVVALQVRNLLNGFAGVEELKLNVLFVKARQSELPLCRFDKLRRLTLVRAGGTNELLIELLHATPTLKFLSIKYPRHSYNDYEALKSIPVCVRSHLEEVVFVCRHYNGYRAPSPSYELVEFFFKNAEQLKKFRIVASIDDDIEVINKLSTMPTGSPCVMIEFA